MNKELELMENRIKWAIGEMSLYILGYMLALNALIIYYLTQDIFMLIILLLVAVIFVCSPSVYKTYLRERDQSKTNCKEVIE